MEKFIAAVFGVIAYIAGPPVLALVVDASFKALGWNPSLSTVIACVFYVVLMVAIPVIVLPSFLGGSSSRSRI